VNILCIPHNLRTILRHFSPFYSLTLCHSISESCSILVHLPLASVSILKPCARLLHFRFPSTESLSTPDNMYGILKKPMPHSWFIFSLPNSSILHFSPMAPSQTDSYLLISTVTPFVQFLKLAMQHHVRQAKWPAPSISTPSNTCSLPPPRCNLSWTPDSYCVSWRPARTLSRRGTDFSSQDSLNATTFHLQSCDSNSSLFLLTLELFL